MKIALTGARGTVGRECVKVCVDAGHHVVEINRNEEEPDQRPNTEMRTADIANDYRATVAAFKGCDALIHLAAIPTPVGQEDAMVHNNNTNSAFNGFRAAAALGITKIAYASSVNAIGLAYANQPLKFDYFPIDEEAPSRPTDAYALAKIETELQAQSFAHWFPGTKIGCLRIHEVAPRAEVAREHREDWEGAGVKQLWGWVHPAATARACLAVIEKSDHFAGAEVFNIHAPTTAQETPSRELARQYYPEAKIRGDWGKGNESFWTTDKAERILGWKHVEQE